MAWTPWIPPMGRPSHHGSRNYHGDGDLDRSDRRPAPPSAAWAGRAIWGRDAERRTNVGRYAEDGRRRSPLPCSRLGEERGAPIREGARRGNQSGQGMSRRNQRGWAGRLQAAALGACQGSRVGAWEQGEDTCGRESEAHMSADYKITGRLLSHRLQHGW